MKNLILTGAMAVSFFQQSLALAQTPRINIIFSDPARLCQNSTGATQFSFNYKYAAGSDIEYYSGPVLVNNSREIITAPPLPDDGSVHTFTDFEITGQGDCGDLDLDYNNLGPCYLTNLIPMQDQQSPFSYQIVITPEKTTDNIYQRSMYHLKCMVRSVASTLREKDGQGQTIKI